MKLPPLKMDDFLPRMAYWESQFEYIERTPPMGLPFCELFLLGLFFAVI